jgi:endonuclease VIII
VPEGDTIHRTAAALDRVLAGEALVRFEAPTIRFRPFAEGTSVEGVDAVGKHCLVHFDDGRTLRTHLRMNGSWHLYRRGESWQRSRGALRALVAVPEWEAVCFAAPDVELTTTPAVAHLGPDLVRPDADLDEAVRRMAGRGGTVGDALLDQRVAAGIGNIWRNEACFACGVDPDAPLDGVPEATRRRLLDVAAQKLRASTAGRRPAMAVHGRAGQPCRRCGTPISAKRAGAQQRRVFWCPACQPPGAGT